MRMPLPPPPADALTITGMPISRATAIASAASSMTPRWPGTVETPASAASFFDSILSPSTDMAPTFGPMKAMPAASSARAKAPRSDRKP
jgi:hypothetical protein